MRKARVLECDELVVPVDLWDRAARGDPEAGAELVSMFGGTVLYVHALAGDGVDASGDGWVKVTARELCRVTGDRLTLTVGFD